MSKKTTKSTEKIVTSRVFVACCFALAAEHFQKEAEKNPQDSVARKMLEAQAEEAQRHVRWFEEEKVTIVKVKKGKTP